MLSTFLLTIFFGSPEFQLRTDAVADHTPPFELFPLVVSRLAAEPNIHLQIGHQKGRIL